MPLRPTPLHLDVEDRLRLEDLLRSRRTPDRLRVQCQILLLGAEGHANAAIASRLNLTRSTVLKWRRRFRKGTFGALGPVSEAPASDLRRQRVERLKALLQAAPSGGWTVRALAQATGMSVATVQRTLATHGLSPNPRGRGRRWDGAWRTGWRDLVGLYVHAPWHAVVLEGEADPGATDGTGPGLDARRAAPGDPAWLLHILLRSLEGLQQGGAEGAPSAFGFWRFLLDLPPPAEGRVRWCLSDAPLPEEGLAQLARLRPELRFLPLGARDPWSQMLRSRLIPSLHARWEASGCPSLGAALEALEGFLHREAEGAFSWHGGAGTPAEVPA